MKIEEYLDSALLEQMLREGYVRKQTNGSLAIYNYTPKAQYERVWNDVTRKCRGLIVDEARGTVESRPFAKFFNWGEADREMLPGGPIRVTEKMDGSLGILYEDRSTNRLRIATRGSFLSDQARHATEVLHARYEDFRPYAGYTYLFEIIYPENRIVVNYGEMDDLVLLDVLNTETGISVLDTDINNWPGPVVEHHEFESLEQVVETQRENAEGFVVMFEKDQSRIKVKHDDYVRLHRLVTGVNAKTIWEFLSEGRDIEEILQQVPDEFYAWVKETADDLKRKFSRIKTTGWTSFLVSYMRANGENTPGSREHRKAFALEIKDSSLKSLYWCFYDDKPVDEVIWKMIQPQYSRPYWNVSEDVA